MWTPTALFDPRQLRGAAVLAALVAAATIIGAHLFEWAGYAPCELCLEQRYAYYAAIPLAALAAILAGPSPKLARVLLAVLALIFAANALYGVYHSGVEWGWWPGPADCSPTNGAIALPGQAGSLLQQMQRTRVVSCTEAALRIFGLSLAGWSAIVCAGLAALTARAATRA